MIALIDDLIIVKIYFLFYIFLSSNGCLVTTVLAAGLSSHSNMCKYSLCLSSELLRDVFSSLFCVFVFCF